MEETSPVWWVRLGYPPFDAAEDEDFPRPGQVVRYYRYLMFTSEKTHWTQRDLALALGVTENTIANLENKDKGMDSYSRRRALAEILKIPPILLGLAFLPDVPAGPEIKPDQHTARGTGSPLKAVDLSASKKALAQFWQQHHSSTVLPAFGIIEQEINSLYIFLPFARREKEETQRLLCCYHILAGNILRDQKDASSSVHHLNRAVAFAKSLQDPELHADALFRRSGIYRDGALGQDSPQLLVDALTAEADLSQLPPDLATVVLVRAASAELQIAQDQSDRQKALTKFDRASRLLGTAQTENSHYLFYDQDRLAIDRAWAFTDIGWWNEALKALSTATRYPEKKRRTAFSDILQARALIGLEKYPQAAALLDMALSSVIEVRSAVNLLRIKGLVADLRESSFGNNPEVVRLAYRLRQPTGF